MSETALALPDENQFKADIQAINRFQQVVHANLIPNQDYGVIPGTQKPTLLKPGAEKIAKLLGLADEYEIVDKQEDWNRPFFRYLIKCSLRSLAHQVVISEGLGECNSMEAKYHWRWIGERDLPEGIERGKLLSQERHSKAGGKWRAYRLENDDIYSQVNTILKMAKKRALVDAALSAGRLSNVFTQDIEDIPELPEDKPMPANEPALSPEIPPGASGSEKQAVKETTKPIPRKDLESTLFHQSNDLISLEVWTEAKRQKLLRELGAKGQTIKTALASLTEIDLLSFQMHVIEGLKETKP